MLEDSDSGSGRVFEIFIQILICISLLAFAFETLPDLSARSRKLLRLLEWTIVAIFTLEYLARLIFSRDRLKFVFSFYGIVDLLAILPFYLMAGTDTRSFRGLRFLRLLRVFKLVRYNEAAQRFVRALYLAKEELLIYLILTLFLMYFAAVGIYFFEHRVQPDVYSSVFHSLWWAVATLTTVGYGDIYPITAGGKIFTFLVLVIGLGVVSVPAALISAALTEVRQKDQSS